MISETDFQTERHTDFEMFLVFSWSVLQEIVSGTELN